MFCSRVVDVKTEVISDTIKDIRSFIRFNTSFFTTYAVEFTDAYKVFTIYRSCHDSGTGDYVAITVYVPHDLKVRNIRKALTARMDQYFREFVHPVSGTYNPNTYDSIDQYVDFIDNALDIVPDRERYVYRRSEQDDRPHLLVYQSEAELDGYFDRPYRPEFFVCQEVMFMNEALYQRNGQDYNFNVTPEKISKVSEPEKLPHLSLGGDMKVYSVKINGEQCDKLQDLPVNSTDRVEIVLQQDRCEDYILKGTISELKGNRQLVENDKSIKIGSNIHFQYKTYTVMFKFNDRQVPNDLLNIRAGKFDEQGIAVKDSEARIPGDKLNQDWQIFLKIGKDEILVGSFQPSEYVNNGECKRVVCDEHEFRVVFEKKVEGYFFISLRKCKKDLRIPIPKDSGTSLTVYLPEGEKLEFDKQDGSLDLSYDSERKILTITRKITEFELYVPKEVKDHIDSWDFSIEGVSRKPDSYWGRTSYKVELGKDDSIENGKLEINKKRRKFTVVGDKIYPKIVLLKVGGNGAKIEFTIDGNKLDATQDCICSYSKKCDFECITSGYTFDKREDNGVFIIELTKKLENDSRYEASMSKTLSEEPANPNISFYGCKGLYFYSGYQNKDIKIREDVWERKELTCDIVIKTRKGEELCCVHKKEEEYNETDKRFNEGKGFTVNYDKNGNEIEVKRKKKGSIMWALDGVSERLEKVLKALGILSLLAILGIGGYFAWDYYNKKDNIIEIIKIPIQLDEGNNDWGDKIIDIQVENGENCASVTANRDSLIVYGCYNDEGNLECDCNDLGIKVQLKFGKEVSINKLAEEIIKEVKEALNEARSSDIYEPKRATNPIRIKSPIQDLYEKAASLDGEKAIDAYAEALKWWETKEGRDRFCDSVMEKASQCINDNLDLMDFYLKKFNADTTNSSYKEVKNKFDGIQQVKKDAEQMKAKMWSLDFGPKGLKQVKQWWNNLGQDDKQIAKEVYPFDQGIKHYGTFFSKKQWQEFEGLKNQNVFFSSDQMNIINRFTSQYHVDEWAGHPKKNFQIADNISKKWI